MKIFIDTSAFISYFVKQEAYHKEVVQKYTDYRTHRARFFTSDYILDELYTWFCRHQPPSVLKRLSEEMQQLEQARDLAVFMFDLPFRKKALDVQLKFSEHKLSFTDATTYVFYKNLALDEIFTLDTDFKKLRLPVSFPNLR